MILLSIAISNHQLSLSLLFDEGKTVNGQENHEVLIGISFEFGALKIQFQFNCHLVMSIYLQHFIFYTVEMNS